MEELSFQEMTNINGGGIALGIWGIIAAAATFIIGVIDGFLRPYKCR